ncbi:MAG: DUF1971 domain-containing protein [Alphaproteobacteria bacterium]|jgi:tellurite resistance-related uncharacterized protein|nr:DUF1971 domain-containing protein [Alphaproteobacteria bacterium]
MKSLPQNVQSYSRTATFTQDTVPKGLLKDHTTKENVWGLIQVQSGKLEYTIQNEESHILDPERDGVIEPLIPHHIKPLGLVSFYVEFYK